MVKFLSDRQRTLSIGITNYTEGRTVLDVTGNVNVAGSLISTNLNVGAGATINGITYPSSDGSSNQVLATNGSGQLQFLDISSIQSFDWGVDSNFGLITESVTTSTDSGLITETASSTYELGLLVISGSIYPNTLVLPSYTVATLPRTDPAGQMLFVTDETGGSIPAFSDGVNWRRVSDRQIVS